MKDIRHKFGDINRFSLRFSYNFTSLIDLSLLVVVWLDLRALAHSEIHVQDEAQQQQDKEPLEYPWLRVLGG